MSKRIELADIVASIGLIGGQSGQAHLSSTIGSVVAVVVTQHERERKCLCEQAQVGGGGVKGAEAVQRLQQAKLTC